MKRRLLASMMVFGSLVGAAQKTTISGKVTGPNGEPLQGVSVTVKGGTAGTTTNEKGVYILPVTGKGVFLVFSSSGYGQREISAGNNFTINVALQEKVTEAEEVVVVGYGTVKRKDVTGSVGKINMAEMSKAPVRSFDEALAGRVAGVQVTSSDGQPGSATNIVIRGANSLTSSNAPLYVIDGFQVENPNSNAINPSDIESIEVLKDASATAIFGARGANGVILITTKKGKEGPPVVSFTGTYGLQNNIRTMEMMSPYEFVKYQLEVDTTAVSNSMYPSPRQVYLANGKSLEEYRQAKEIDWQELVLRQAPMSNYNLSITGGNKQTKYALSGSLLDQQGTLVNSGYKRYQGRIVLDQNINTRLKVGINTNFSNLVQSGVSPSQTSYSAMNNIMVSVWGGRPVSPNVTSGMEDLLFDPSIDPANDYRVNPAVNLKNLVRDNITRNLTANAYAEYLILPRLKLRVTGGYMDNQLRQEQFNNSLTQYGNLRQPNGVNGSLTFQQSSSWLNENTLAWDTKINDHSLNLLGGFTLQGDKSSRYGMSAIQLPNEKLGISGLDEGVLQPLTATSSLSSMSSFLGRMNYSYKSKYLLTASFRADGSSRFSEAHHWSFFPSAALSWRFKSEDFLKNLDVLSDGKLRLSYGHTGNNRVGDFSYLTAFGLPIGNNYVFNNSYVAGIVPTGLGNKNLKWETTQQANLGLDLGFFNQRLTLGVDAYQKKTVDLLLYASLPPSVGYDKAYKNIGSVQNRGLELTLGTVNVTGRDFSWNTGFNISFNRSKVLALAENEESLKSTVAWDQGWQNTSAYIAKLGMPMGLMYGYIWDGVYQYADFDRTASGGYILKDNVPTNGNTRNLIQPGDIRYRDLTGDGVVNASDYTVIGRGLPVHTGGFTNNFSYKGFDLNVFFQWSYGNDLYNANRLMFDGNAMARANMNQFASYAHRWTPENTQSTIFRTKGYYGGGYSSFIVEDGSYLRLKTVSLGYNVAPKILKHAKIKSLRAYVSAQNLLTWTNYSGMDPEVNAYNSALTPGFDFSTYPRARTTTLGVNLSF
ncbi:TonB-dependent receptor [Paraflavisolibacter sp. H34]|uniref:SusC/RagA family TonB-linked outer membrane protein n=1 Tax=Huijunlia imazamoxiresistens TaxID=3127457 RepID=UPI00301765DA